jgi:hypothetical protein
MLVQAQDGRYFQDALNLSPHEIDEADLTMDLCDRAKLALDGGKPMGAIIAIGRQQIEKIVIRNAPETDAAWQSLCSNAMQLLKDNGHLIFELPMAQLDDSGSQGPQFKTGKKVLIQFYGVLLAS